MTNNVKRRLKKVSKINWNRLGFFVLGTFTGGYVLGLIGGILGRKG